MKNLQHFSISLEEGDDFKVKNHMLTLLSNYKSELNEAINQVQQLEVGLDSKGQDLDSTTRELSSWEQKYKALEMQH